MLQHILHKIDLSVFYFANGTCHNDFFEIIMPWITEIGSGEFLFMVALILLLFREREKTLSLLLLAGLTLSFHFSYILKNIVLRPRPFSNLQNVIIHETVKSFSFPSTHSTYLFHQ